MSDNVVYAIDDELYCYWAASRTESAMQFLDSLDSGYFAFVADQGGACLGNPTLEKRSAASMRIAFFQGTETLLLLLGAFAQAPGCPQAWMVECKPPQLREVTRKITDGGTLLHLNDLLNAASWTSVADAVLRTSGQKEMAGLGPRFARFWQQLAHTYLRREFDDEYNALIHGIGVKAAGVPFRGTAASRCSANQDAVAPSRGSRWATSFKITRPVGSDGRESRSRYSVDQHIDWDAEQMVEALHCISASIHNVVAAFRIVHGAGDVTFMVPVFGESEFPRPRSASSIALSKVPQGARPTSAQELGKLALSRPIFRGP